MTFTPGLTREERSGIGVLVDEGAAERGVLVAFTDRRGGASSPPYAELNLAARVGDDVDTVMGNRRRAAAALGFDSERLVLSRQVHGKELLEVTRRDSGVIGEGDGLVAAEAGPVLSILTADCAPVVLAGGDGVAVLHAGWRGLVAGVLPAGVKAMGHVSAAWVGPCIKSCCYEVGDEVTNAFEDAGLPVASPNRVDIADAARASLAAAGVMNVALSEVCTHCNPNYYSHRRDGVTGRQGAFAARLER